MGLKLVKLNLNPDYDKVTQYYFFGHNYFCNTVFESKSNSKFNTHINNWSG